MGQMALMTSIECQILLSNVFEFPGTEEISEEGKRCDFLSVKISESLKEIELAFFWTDLTDLPRETCVKLPIPAYWCPEDKMGHDLNHKKEEIKTIGRKWTRRKK
jgi:hypothetical protein